MVKKSLPFDDFKVAVVLNEKLKIIQRQLEARFETIRDTHQHKGSKGSNVEQIIRDFLREYLPIMNRVGEGEVIDQNGNYSSQTDIVITNEYHPFLNDLKQPEVFFIEGVVCVGEIKSVLTSEELKTTLEKCVAFKKLTPRIGVGTLVQGNKADIARFVEKRAYFLLAFQSQLKLNTVMEKIIEFNHNNSLELNSQIDAVFLLDKGTIINFGDGEGSLKFKSHDGEWMGGINIIAEQRSPLFELLSWLSIVNKKTIRFESVLVPYLFQNKFYGKDD